MPNVAAEVAHGTFCYAAAPALDERTERTLLDLFGLLGELVPVEERLMDAATAISGCGRPSSRWWWRASWTPASRKASTRGWRRALDRRRWPGPRSSCASAAATRSGCAAR